MSRIQEAGASQCGFLLPQAPINMHEGWGHLQLHRASRLQRSLLVFCSWLNGFQCLFLRSATIGRRLLEDTQMGYELSPVSEEAHQLLCFLFISVCSQWR